MTDEGLTRPARPALSAGRILLRLLGVILSVPFWLVWLLFVLTLPFGRALVQFPLSLAVIGGVAVGIYFGLHHAWGDAASAVVIAVVSGAALAAYTFIAETIDPAFSRPTPWPPWWWYF